MDDPHLPADSLLDGSAAVGFARSYPALAGSCDDCSYGRWVWSVSTVVVGCRPLNSIIGTVTRSSGIGSSWSIRRGSGGASAGPGAVALRGAPGVCGQITFGHLAGACPPGPDRSGRPHAGCGLADRWRLR